MCLGRNNEHLQHHILQWMVDSLEYGPHSSEWSKTVKDELIVTRYVAKSIIQLIAGCFRLVGLGHQHAKLQSPLLNIIVKSLYNQLKPVKPLQIKLGSVFLSLLAQLGTLVNPWIQVQVCSVGCMGRKNGCKQESVRYRIKNGQR